MISFIIYIKAITTTIEYIQLEQQLSHLQSYTFFYHFHFHSYFFFWPNMIGFEYWNEIREKHTYKLWIQRLLFFRYWVMEREHTKCVEWGKLKDFFSYFIFYPPWHVKYEMLYATFLSLDFYFVNSKKNWVWMNRKIVFTNSEWEGSKVRVENLWIWAWNRKNFRFH